MSEKIPEIVSIAPRPFKTQFHSRLRRFAKPGSKIKKNYVGRYDEYGHIVLEESGEENLYDYIQSHADSVDIQKIIKRFNNGEIDVLSRVQGTYGDFTNMPTNLAESLNMIQNCEDAFMALPVEVRAKFGHNFVEFLSGAGKPEFFEALGLNKQPDQAEKEVSDES